MKRLLRAMLSLTLLVSCAAPAEVTPEPSGAAPQPPTAQAPTGTEWADYYAQVILYSQPDGEEYTSLSPEDGAFYLSMYGIPLREEEESFGYAVYTVSGVEAREIAVVCGSDAGAAGMEAYRRSRADSFAGYVPDQAALAEKGLVLHGNMLVLLLCTDPEAGRRALETAAPSLVLTPYDPARETSEPYDWENDVNQKGWKLFDPPDQFDMTPYDTRAILEAWETGEESGLTEKDSAILAKCREALELAIKPGMTDFQKELNLHDWLVQSYYGCYDRTVHDPETPMGREDNLNPYGLLIRGYGICLSYATTFQLLMDLAGVECMTVVGASSGSGSDHAWNMVRLEGEWYCVDPTWNSTYKEGLTEETMWPWQHRYFNVTSDYMRETDHQWDYANVPEAAATRFRWDGTGKPPQ